MIRAALLLCLLLCVGAHRAAPLAADNGCSNNMPSTLSVNVDTGGSYCELGYLIPGVITLGTYYLPPPTFYHTRTYYYAPGLMGETARLKGYTADEEYVALMSPATVGWRVWIRLPGHEWIAARVVDDVARLDYYYHAVMTRSGMEVSYSLAQRLGIIDWVNADGSRYPDMDVCTTESDPTGVCTGEPADFTKWFLSIVRYQN